MTSLRKRALAGIGIAVTLYPVVKRQNNGIALGLVATRTLEATKFAAWLPGSLPRSPHRAQ